MKDKFQIWNGLIKIGINLPINISDSQLSVLFLGIKCPAGDQSHEQKVYGGQVASK